MFDYEWGVVGIYICFLQFSLSLVVILRSNDFVSKLLFFLEFKSLHFDVESTLLLRGVAPFLLY